MTQKKNPKRRTQVKDLPRKEKELGKAEQRKVKGGGKGLNGKGLNSAPQDGGTNSAGFILPDLDAAGVP